MKVTATVIWEDLEIQLMGRRHNARPLDCEFRSVPLRFPWAGGDPADLAQALRDLADEVERTADELRQKP